MRRWTQKLAVEGLETRDVPAQWYTVALASPAQGQHGDSSLAVTAGGLTATDNTDEDGTVWADSPAEAVRLVLGGQVTVGDRTYVLRPDTLSTDPADRTPFLLLATAEGYEVRLEDMAATPAQSDWDHNDTTSTVPVALYTVPPGAAPAAEPETPPSEKGGGSFREQFLKLLGKGGGELPDGWEAHHELVERLQAVWVRLGLKWNQTSDTNGLGVPGLLNTEFNTLYERWLKEFNFPDYSKMTPEELAKVPTEELERFKKEFDKLNKAIREYYKDYIILPTDTKADVDRKEAAWMKALHPTGSNVAGDTDAWKRKQKDRFDAIWVLIRAQ